MYCIEFTQKLGKPNNNVKTCKLFKKIRNLQNTPDRALRKL